MVSTDSQPNHAQEKEEKLIGWEQEIEMHDVERAPPTSYGDSWYKYVFQYLEHGTMPSHFSMRQKRALRLKALRYQLVHGVLYTKHNNEIFLRCLRCLEEHDSEKVLHDLHDKLAGGHFMTNTTAHKVMHVGFY